MGINLSGFKVVYGEHVLNAIALDGFSFGEEKFPRSDGAGEILKPKFITVIAINGDGNIVFISDEAWRFQFLPIVKGAA